MSGSNLQTALADASQCVEPSQPTPDQELLTRFLEGRDERAFADIMKRHGGMVLGVCKRMLKNVHDAEDACQAVFLVLARKANSIRKTGSLASWLHGVAWLVSNKLRVRQTRRAAKEASAAVEKPAQSESVDMSWRDVIRLVDEELQRLPKVYAEPLVLCYLEGKTQDEAVRELGWTLGMLRGRMRRGREMLKARLTRRGVTSASAVAIAALVPSLACADVPAVLIETTAHVSVSIAAGEAMPAAVSAQVAALTQEAVQTSLFTKLIVGAFVSMSAAMIALVVYLNTGDSTPDVAAAPPVAKVWAETDRLEIPDSHVWSVAYSHDGKRIAAGSGVSTFNRGELRVWNVDTKKILVTQVTTQAVRSVVFAPDGKTLATAEHDGRARLRDAATGEVLFTLTGHRTQIDIASFSPDGKTLATTGWDGTVRLWDATNGKELRTLTSHKAQVFTVAFGGPDGTLASGGADGTARIWRPDRDKPLFILRGHRSTVHWLAYSPDGKLLATASWDKTVKLWDAATGEIVTTLEGHTDQVLALAFSPDGNTLASAAANRDKKDPVVPGEIILWDLPTEKPRTRIQTKDRVYGLTFSPDGDTLAFACWDGTVALLKKENSTAVAVNEFNFVTAVDQQPDDTPIAKKEYAENFQAALKGDAATVPGLTIYGPDAEACVKFEPDGLRITLPSGYPRARPGTGVVTDFGVKGDFEITLGFEIVPNENAGPNSHFASLKLLVVPHEPAEPEVWHKANQNRAAVTRETVVRKGVGHFFATAAKWNPDVPRDKWGNEVFTNVETHTPPRMAPAQSPSGRVRLMRSGAQLYFFTSDGDGKEFKLLQKHEFGDKDLKNVRVLASTNSPNAAADFRVTALEVRADGFVKNAPSAAPASAPAEQSTSLVMPIAIVAASLLALVLAFTLVFVVLMRRRTAPAKPARAETPKSETISFACTACGKRLKVKVDRVGKKLKCPHCAAVVNVAKANSGERS